MEKVLEFFNGDSFVGSLLIANLVFVCVSKALEVAKDKFKSEGAGKIGVVFSKIAEWAQKLIDILGNNPKHK